VTHDRPATPYQTFVYYLDFFLYPAIVLACLWYDFENAGLSRLLLFVTGFIVWTLAEYWIHRSVLHGPLWMDIHERHHNHPRELTAFPIWQIPSYFVIILILTWAIVGDAWPPVYGGIVTGFMMFGTMHHLMHHVEDLRHYPWLYQFARRHTLHHKRTDKNFGISTDIWDRVFGTYQQPKERA
jgi:sterol desaturase/sphingolipid hydroxylase (fatty acid hydroxylase superfamily)